MKIPHSVSHSTTFLLSMAIGTWATLAHAQTITLEQAMADPDWIGRAPQQPYWSDDSDSVYFTQKREGSRETDLFRLSADGGELELVEPAARAEVDVAGGDYSSNRRLKTYSRAGDVFVRNVRNGDITQLTRTAANETNPRFSADDERVIFQRGNTVFVRDLDSGLEYQAADIRLEDVPDTDPEDDYLTQQQLRLFDIVRLDRQREELATEQSELLRSADQSRLALPYYLGANSEIIDASLSPNERWMLVTLRDITEQDDGRDGTMPNYVTASGYVENREVRTRVGTTDFANQQLFLFDLMTHEYAEVDLSALPDRSGDPLARQLGEESDDDSEPRDIRVFSEWSDNGERAILQALSRDNKDRWLVGLELNGLSFAALETAASEDEQDKTDESLRAALTMDSKHLSLVHHQHDPAWINLRGFIDVGFLPDNETVYFLSEADGYGHLYLSEGGAERQVTAGKFEVLDLTVNQDGDAIYFRGNLEHPTIWEIYRVDLDDGAIDRLTELGGLNSYVLSPDESKLLVTHSEALQPPELFVQNARTGATATRITNTVSDEFVAIDWAQPEFIEVPSSYVSDPIHSRVYTPDDSNSSRPAVVFIHGAGYLQNAHQGWSNYFREFMFHSFLVQQGYVVLDMDYRASSGYGRDWRTAIYQQMGTPEVQDLRDGVNWLVANKNVDRDRVCTYGGSYGGFLTLMSLFNEPDLFACGAALRPVTDWAAYNHGYTSNILNIPELDPGSYERSSPIEFAEGLEKPLLIAHGMQDDNVFFQDSVRLVQRLIELEKENWEMAIYPIEPHGFREPSSWLDEYRRIYKLVKETVGE